MERCQLRTKVCSSFSFHRHSQKSGVTRSFRGFLCILASLPGILTQTHTHTRSFGGEEEETSRHTGSSRFCASYAFTNQIVAYRTKAPKGLLGFGCRTPIVVRFADLLQFYRHRSCFVRGGVRSEKEAIRSPDTRKSS